MRIKWLLFIKGDALKYSMPVRRPYELHGDQFLTQGVPRAQASRSGPEPCAGPSGNNFGS